MLVSATKHNLWMSPKVLFPLTIIYNTNIVTLALMLPTLSSKVEDFLLHAMCHPNSENSSTHVFLQHLMTDSTWTKGWNDQKKTPLACLGNSRRNFLALACGGFYITWCFVKAVLNLAAACSCRIRNLRTCFCMWRCLAHLRALHVFTLISNTKKPKRRLVANSARAREWLH